MDDRVAVTAKLNMADGVPGGLWLEESVEVARLLEADGGLDALTFTGGSSLANPMYLFRGEFPAKNLPPPCPGPCVSASGSWAADSCRTTPSRRPSSFPTPGSSASALDMPLVLLGGINELSTVERALSEGFSFVAMARALLREPDLVTKMSAGTSRASLCIHCNKCMPTIYSGTRCVLVGNNDRPSETSS